MSFFSKMQNALANWMQGRNGPDNLGFHVDGCICRYWCRYAVCTEFHQSII